MFEFKYKKLNIYIYQSSSAPEENLILFPNLITYGAIKVVTTVTTPKIGSTEDEMAPMS